MTTREKERVEAARPPVTQAVVQALTSPCWVPILLYHRVVPVLPPDPYGVCVSTATFEGQLKWLAQHGYSSTPLSALQTLFDPNGGGRGALPRRAVVITFDDGYEDNYLYAWPILKRHGFTATIFVVGDSIGGDNSFDRAFTPEQIPIMSAQQMREMHRQGIGFGAHTCSHPAALPELPEGELMHELERPRSVIEGIIDAPVEHFAYPYSRMNGRLEAAVARAGYRLACAGWQNRFTPFCLHRIEPKARQGNEIARQIRYHWLKWLVKGRRGLDG